MKIGLYLWCLGLFPFVFQNAVYAEPASDPPNRCCSYVKSDGTKFCDASHKLTYPKHECKRRAKADGATTFRWGPTKEKGANACIDGICVDEKGNPFSERKLIVNLSLFTLLILEDGIQVNWLTEFEESNLGMNLWCAQMQGHHFEKITRLNTQLIPSKAILANYGASYSSADYSYIDTNLEPGVQHCTLEDIDDNGQCTLHCDHIDTVVIGGGQSAPNPELNQLNAKAIALCHRYEEELAEAGQGGVCLDQLLRPDTP